MLGNKTVGKSYGELLPFVQGRVDAAALDTLDGVLLPRNTWDALPRPCLGPSLGPH